jgi:hypothetical protein
VVAVVHKVVAVVVEHQQLVQVLLLVQIQEVLVGQVLL